MSVTKDWRLPVLAAVAEEIEEDYPNAASELRSVIRSLTPPTRPNIDGLFSS